MSFFRHIQAVILCSLLLSACQPIHEVRNWLMDNLVSFVPLSVDDSLGERSLDQLRTQFRFVQDPTLERDIQAFAAPLLKVARQDYPGDLQIHVVDSSMVNAFALPGGDIILPTGFLLFTKRVEEVQGVVAHEIAHVLQRHSMQQVMTQVGIGLALQLLLGDASAVIQGLVLKAADLLSLKYSRDDEREADRFGLELLKRANLDTSGLATFFERLQAQHNTPDQDRVMRELEGMLSTHPLTEERLQEFARFEAPSNPRITFSPQRFASMQQRARELQTNG